MPDQKRRLVGHKYEIGKPVTYATRGFAREPSPAPAVPKLTEELAADMALRPGERLEKPQPAPAREERRLPTQKHAVWIVHGMGQQVPFETLDSLAAGILKAGHPANGVAVSPPRVAAVKFAASAPGGKEQVVQRVEIDLQDKDDPARACQLHLYEAYWAPVTEGAARLSDVISFFFNGGLRGAWNAFKPFKRAMFPEELSAVSGEDMQEFTIPVRAVFEVILTLLLLLSLMAINAVIVAAGAAIAHIPAFSMMNFKDHWLQLSAMASGMCAIALTFGMILFLAEMCKPSKLANWKKRFITVVGWIGFGFTAFAILAAALLMSTVTRLECVSRLLDGMNTAAVQGVSTLFLISAAVLAAVALISRASRRSSGLELRGDAFLVFLFVLSFVLHLGVVPALILVSIPKLALTEYLPSWLQWATSFLTSSAWVWPALIALAKVVRELLIQFPGDVAIYVDSNKLDRFCKIRQEIKQIALDSVTASIRRAKRTVPVSSTQKLPSSDIHSAP